MNVGVLHGHAVTGVKTYLDHIAVIVTTPQNSQQQMVTAQVISDQKLWKFVPVKIIDILS